MLKSTNSDDFLDTFLRGYFAVQIAYRMDISTEISQMPQEQRYTGRDLTAVIMTLEAYVVLSIWQFKC